MVKIQGDAVPSEFPSEVGTTWPEEGERRSPSPHNSNESCLTDEVRSQQGVTAQPSLGGILAHNLLMLVDQSCRVPHGLGKLWNAPACFGTWNL